MGVESTTIGILAHYLAIIGTVVIRFPHERVRQKQEISSYRAALRERFLVFLVFLGMYLIPSILLFKPLPTPLDVGGSTYLLIPGIIIDIAALYLFWRSHHDLGRMWSPVLETRPGHTLITSGVYAYVRHPMYTSIFLLTIAQAFLLSSAIAGVSGLICFSILYALRVPDEENMMVDMFGDQYRRYCKRTSRIIPKLL